MKVCIMGHFGHNSAKPNGQTVKAMVLTDELERIYGKSEVGRADTSGRWKALLTIPPRLISALRHYDNIIILPAYKGIRYIMFFIALLHPFFKTKIHYAVVGGWLPSFIKDKKLLARWLHLLDGIYVETSTMQKALESAGYSNIYLTPNCKRLEPVRLQPTQPATPLRLCTFSRVMKGKGIAEAADIVKMINEEAGKIVYTLDIYGPVWDKDSEWFRQVSSEFPEYIRHKGSVPFNDSVNVLKNYFMLLFPTLFYTEGVPGTIIDAYAAGLPVIASEWESFNDVIDEGKTGLGFEFGNFGKLRQLLEQIAANPQVINEMRSACIDKTGEFSPECALSTLISRL